MLKLTNQFFIIVIFTLLSASCLGKDRLGPNEELNKNEFLSSANGLFKLIYQMDNNLVLYHGNVSLWASCTSGTGGTKFIMQGDGNFVFIGSSWNTQTSQHLGSVLILQDDGNLVIQTPKGINIWNTMSNLNGMLCCDHELHINDSITSPNGFYVLKMQTDGNLVESYKDGTKVWNSMTSGLGLVSCRMQSDGNLVLKYPNGNSVYSSNTQSAYNTKLLLNDDGAIVILNQANVKLWYSSSYPSNGLLPPSHAVTPCSSNICCGNACDAIVIHPNPKPNIPWEFVNLSKKQVRIGTKLWGGYTDNFCSNPNYFILDGKKSEYWGMGTQVFCNPFTADYVK